MQKIHLWLWRLKKLTNFACSYEARKENYNFYNYAALGSKLFAILILIISAKIPFAILYFF